MMRLVYKNRFYKSYAIAAFALAGIFHALIIRPHDYSFQMLPLLASITIFSAASFFALLAIKHTHSIGGKICFGLIQVIYALFIALAIVEMAKHGAGYS